MKERGFEFKLSEKEQELCGLCEGSKHYEGKNERKVYPVMMRNIRVREGRAEGVSKEGREGGTAEWQNRMCGDKRKVAIQLWGDRVVSVSFCYCRLSLVYCLCSAGEAW